MRYNESGIYAVVDFKGAHERWGTSARKNFPLQLLQSRLAGKLEPLNSLATVNIVANDESFAP
jgi:hypothetical protein